MGADDPASLDTYAVIDAGTFSQSKRETGRRSNATVIAEILADSADLLAGEVYAALDMPFAVLVGQIAQALTKT